MIRWLAALIIDWLIVALAMWAIWLWPWCAPAAMFVIGTRQLAIAVLGHEAAHGSIGEWPAQILCWWPMAIPFDGYRKFHLNHHRWLGTAADPEHSHKGCFAPRYEPPVTTGRKVRLLALDLIGVTSIPEVIVGAKMFWAESSGRDILGVATTQAMLLTVLIYLGLWWVPVVWFITAITAHWAVNRLRIWREHVGTDGTLDIPVPWWGFMVHLPHGIGYHAEHHQYAWRPFHQLGKGNIS